MILLLLLITAGGLVFGGDVANFVNLGFSDNSQYFMFGQYGIQENNASPYAEIYTVDVKGNSFTKQGVKKAVYPVSIEAGQNGLGALLTLLEHSTSVVNMYSINHMKTGRILYILLNGEEPKSFLKFRDFSTNTSYSIQLVQAEYAISEEVSASFHIDVTVTDSRGLNKNIIVGRPDYRRQGVKSYKIRQIFLSPNENSLVFLVEKEQMSDNGIDIRYMVETVSMK